MSRSLWFVAGAGAGIYAAARARRAAQALTVDGLRDRVGAAVVGLRMVRDEVAQGRADAEPDLRRRMGAVLDRSQAPPELLRSADHTGDEPPTSPTPTTTREQDRS